jgi:protein TonB
MNLPDILGPSPYYPRTSADMDNRFASSVLFSAIVHVALIFGVTFTSLNPNLFDPNLLPLEVVLVNAKSSSAPVQADVYAQANLDGGGDVEEDRHLRSPLPASAQDTPPARAQDAEARVHALEQQARDLLSQIKSNYTAPENAPKATPKPNDQVPAPNPDLSAQSVEMARLAARIDREWDEYQKRPRRENAIMHAKEYAFARYVEDWRVKVERIGNLNYPEAARRNHIYGKLVLTVEVNADGTLEAVHVEKSSGSRVLDAAAIKIVELAAPFAPFPPEMRKQIDIFGITRTWTFTQDQLSSQ